MNRLVLIFYKFQFFLFYQFFFQLFHIPTTVSPSSSLPIPNPHFLCTHPPICSSSKERQDKGIPEHSHVISRGPISKVPTLHDLSGCSVNLQLVGEPALQNRHDGKSAFHRKASESFSEVWRPQGQDLIQKSSATQSKLRSHRALSLKETFCSFL